MNKLKSILCGMLFIPGICSCVNASGTYNAFVDFGSYHQSSLLPIAQDVAQAYVGDMKILDEYQEELMDILAGDGSGNDLISISQQALLDAEFATTSEYRKMTTDEKTEYFRYLRDAVKRFTGCETESPQLPAVHFSAVIAEIKSKLTTEISKNFMEDMEKKLTTIKENPMNIPLVFRTVGIFGPEEITNLLIPLTCIECLKNEVAVPLLEILVMARQQQVVA